MAYSERAFVGSGEAEHGVGIFERAESGRSGGGVLTDVIFALLLYLWDWWGVSEGLTVELAGRERAAVGVVFDVVDFGEIV